MYYELGHFFHRVLFTKALWKDGEFWTAAIGGIASYFWIKGDGMAITEIQNHLDALLTTSSILFGFAVSSLIFYIQVAASWSKDKAIADVADRIVDWHVWTILCLLFLLGYTSALWLLGQHVTKGMGLAHILYSLLCFQVLYCGFQILNHTLTIWWFFRKRDRLNISKEKDRSGWNG